MIVGVLALQGAFSEHINLLKKIKILALEIRTAEQLKGIDALIIPGGESTTMALIAERNNLLDPLIEFVNSGKAVWGTCAGLILLSKNIDHAKSGGQRLIGGLDVLCERNAFGHQKDSFLHDLDVHGFNGKYPGVFIRAPIIREVGPSVQILAKIPEKQDCIVAVRQGNILATAFHPELTQDVRFHSYFVEMIVSSKA